MISRVTGSMMGLPRRKQPVFFACSVNDISLLYGCKVTRPSPSRTNTVAALISNSSLRGEYDSGIKKAINCAARILFSHRNFRCWRDLQGICQPIQPQKSSTYAYRVREPADANCQSRVTLSRVRDRRYMTRTCTICGHRRYGCSSSREFAA